MRWTFVPLFLAALGGAAGREPLPAGDKPVDNGVRWLLRAQNRDGSWGLDAQTSGDVTCTSLAALALMAGGHTERGGPDPRIVESIRRAIDFLLGKARAMRANLSGGTVTLIQNKLGDQVHTFFGLVFLTQVYGMRGPWLDKDQFEELQQLLVQLAQRIVQTQEADGSWHKQFFGSLKATCMAWLGLRSAASVGIDVEKAAVGKTIRFIKAQYNPSTKLFDRGIGQASYQTIYATASCLRVLYAMGEGQSAEAEGATVAFMKFVRSGQMGQAFLTVEGEDYLSALLVTQALLIVEGKHWDEWYKWIRAELVKRQNGDGSWTSTACISGRTFATACALLTLQAPYRQLPIQEQ